MFKIKSEALKGLVNMLVKSARKAGIGDKTIYIRTLEDGLVSFYYHGQDISVEKKVPCEIEGNLEVATSIGELDVKVSALPDEVEVLVQKSKDGGLQFLWGNGGKRKSELRVDILPETSPMVEVPPIEETLKWKPGVLHNIVRYIPPFCLNSNSNKAAQMPNALGPNFSKDDTGRVLVRATDGIKGVIIYPKHLEWFDEPMSIDVSTLQGVADVIPSDAEIEVGLSGGTIVIFKAGYTTAVCRTLIGKFPPIEKYFNTQTKGKLNIDRLELIDVCKRVKLLAPTAALLQIKVVGDKAYAVIPSVLEQALPASIEGDVPSFAVGAVHMEMAALLFAMSKSSDELTLYVNGFDQAISVALDGKEDIRLWCLPHISSFVREANSAQSKPIPTTV
jgi:DNA polymerase III sliding clamp (beta) subunit (PCNA family)